MTTKRPIAVFGDWHGDAGWSLTAIRSAAREGARTALHVGDFGFDFPGAKRGRYENKLNRYLVELELTLVVSLGNHDNHDTASKLEIEADGMGRIRSNIRLLPRGGRAMLEGVVVGGLGGAFSVDANHRTAGRDWWANEEPTEQEARALMGGGPVDLLITHDVPAGVPLRGDFELSEELRRRADVTRHLLADVVQELKPPHLVAGHWHQRLTHDLVRNDGGVTRVDVLAAENSRAGNGILVWPLERPLQIEPLIIKGL
ncbi:UNVERIFIED_ORG: hypothetical protein ABIB13_003223 [Arthrobacter sp. UYEF2]